MGRCEGGVRYAGGDGAVDRAAESLNGVGAPEAKHEGFREYAKVCNPGDGDGLGSIMSHHGNRNAQVHAHQYDLHSREVLQSSCAP